MKYLYILLLILCLSCGKEKSVLLPEVKQSKISEITDHSSAYLFYDITQPDSISLNRNNLIGTTNWVLNVDKRLTLKQAMPSIVFLQNKKRSAKMHKNEASKNYFTCNDKSINSLGFMEFTNVFYHFNNDEESQFTKNKNTNYITLYFSKDNMDLIPRLDLIKQNDNSLKTELILNFKNDLTFQDYITIKSILIDTDLNGISLSEHEFIY